tara:strand:- start:5789 stop:8017 length:2229 start_codon:yes stop_codon:yes gene_type:complete
MAEKIVSPGVFTRENDLSFVQQGVGAIGAAIIGPTVKGPALIPTQVFSYSEYQAKFGDSFKSGSDYYQYFTSITAREYLKHGGPLTVVRILPQKTGDNYSNATASTHMTNTLTAGTAPTVEYTFAAAITDGDIIQLTSSNGVGVNFVAETGPGLPIDNPSAVPATYYFAVTNTSAQADAASFATKAAAILSSGASSMSISNTAGGIVELTGSINTNNPPLISITSGSTTTPSTNGVANTGSWEPVAGVPNSSSLSSTNFTASFHIKTISDGSIMNSTPTGSDIGQIGTNDVLTMNNFQYGTGNNLRWEVGNINEKKGTFTLFIRRGDDSSKRKVIIETFNGCSLDPTANNYVGNIVGTAYNTVGDPISANPFIQPRGSWPNRSKHIFIEESTVLQTVDYLDDNGSLTNAEYTSSLPQKSSGSFGGGSDGDIQHPQTFYEAAGTSAANIQGMNCTSATTSGYKSYTTALNLLKNADEYDINLMIMPGINDLNVHGLHSDAITMCEERSDVMAILDPVPFGQSLAQATVEAGDRDSSYAAMYWPWVQIADPSTGRYVWVPQSVVMPGIYAFNDKVSAEWFAPAGLNRGGQEIVVQAERKLTHANRDELYEASVNPVATFPGEGVVVWGQKTLQKKASALDRVNVRRLLINLKKFIASVSKYLIFENNTAATRNRFLSQVNPYMESVQQRQGLYAFKVVMDESNNTPDVIDRNIMKGDIFIQPAKAAEFIVIDFNIMPTGATFND